MKKIGEILLYCISEINKEIGSKKFKEFIEASCFRKIIKIIKIILLIAASVSAVMSIYSFFESDNDSIALENYQKGIIYFEDEDLEQAEKFFKKAYSINKDLLNIKYYYAVTEFFLDNVDMSYNILKENRYSLNEDEIAFYARFESDRGNYDICREFINKIQKPEKLQNLALAQYVIVVLNLAFIENYDELCNAVYMNTILLNRKINENQNLIEDCKINDIDIEQEIIDKKIEHIIQDAEDEIIMLKMYKLCMYMYFSNYAILYNHDELPVYIFVEASESIDYLNYGKISVQFLDLLGYYTIYLDMSSKYPEEIKIAYKNVMEKYDKLIEDGIELTDETRKAFEVVKSVSEGLTENTFDSNNYNYIFPDGKQYENISSVEFLKIWDNLILNKNRSK
ncbi:hypothetical protein [uncultured Brachyspira sp.]|jgi:hypothetical protein|uniref:hypothetical protein n=1 Tax=uncultured Brachyspira sp. TaxID=221953 RepID=UPI00262CA8FE|nr:hypothetical protein [uncultured Brachyspira sp.]